MHDPTAEILSVDATESQYDFSRYTNELQHNCMPHWPFLQNFMPKILLCTPKSIDLNLLLFVPSHLILFARHLLTYLIKNSYLFAVTAIALSLTNSFTVNPTGISAAKISLQTTTYCLPFSKFKQFLHLGKRVNPPCQETSSSER